MFIYSFSIRIYGLLEVLFLSGKVFEIVYNWVKFYYINFKCLLIMLVFRFYNFICFCDYFLKIVFNIIL